MASQRREVLVFDVGGQRFGLAASDVREIVRAVAITPLPQAPASIEGVINLRGQVAPVIDLHRLLGLPAQGVALSDHFVIAHLDSALLALRVDRAIEFRSGEIENEVALGRVIKVAGGLVPLLELHDLLVPEEWMALRAWLGLEGAA